MKHNIENATKMVAKMLETNTRMVPMLIGDAGVGKTVGLRNWAKAQGYTVGECNLATQPMDAFAVFAIIDGKLTVTLDSIFENDLIIFDEALRNKPVLNQLLTMTQDKVLYGQKITSKFVFASNVGADYDVEELDPAQYGRFVFIEVAPEYREFTSYMRKAHNDNPDLVSLLSFIRKNNLLIADDGRVNPRTWDELCKLGVRDFYKIMLPESVADMLSVWFTNELFPDYNDASETNWVPRYAELDYVLGAAGTVKLPVFVKLMKIVSVDTMPIVLRELASSGMYKLREALFADDEFAKYVESLDI